MEERYDPQKKEKKWQQYWDEQNLFAVKEDTALPKFYCLEMFPYPSGRIHMGHVRNYVIGDVITRYKKMRGFNVLHPMGWDAFGLPAENAAIKHGVHPSQWTYENIKYMKEQLKKMGLGYDWKREVTTCNPEYYRWNQWFFLKMLERGLAYKKASSVNWCPSCETVLAGCFVGGGDSVLIYYGRADFAEHYATVSDPDVTIDGKSETGGGHSGSGFGEYIAFMGDVNDDGFGDLVIANPKRTMMTKGIKRLNGEYKKMTKKKIRKLGFNVKIVGDDLFCCIGTTIKKAGSKEAFEFVDLKLPVEIAKNAKQISSNLLWKLALDIWDLPMLRTKPNTILWERQ